MKFNILSLFPDFFSTPLRVSLLGKSLAGGLLDVELINLREFAVNHSGQVDDSPYGGGAGMILMVEPIEKAISKIRKKEKTHVVLLSPQGKTLTQKMVHDYYALMSNKTSLTLICGHYEGVDQRVADYIVDETLSVGDYILSGGESAALLVLESISRLLPGFMGNQKSLENETFSEEKHFKYLQYTRPAIYNGWKVPDTLLSGNHQEIKKWRERST